MRSEKEIKEFIKYIQDGKISPDDLKQMLKEIPETKDATLEELVMIRTIYLGVCQAYGKWILEGEPRYSIAEIEKIIKEEFGGYFGSTNLVVKWNEMEKQFIHLLEVLKNTKKVQEALK